MNTWRRRDGEGIRSGREEEETMKTNTMDCAYGRRSDNDEIKIQEMEKKITDGLRV